MDAFNQVRPSIGNVKDIACSCIDLDFPAGFGADLGDRFSGAEVDPVNIGPIRNFCLCLEAARGKHIFKGNGWHLGNNSTLISWRLDPVDLLFKHKKNARKEHNACREEDSERDPIMDLPKKAFWIDFHDLALAPDGAEVNIMEFCRQLHMVHQARPILPQMLE